MRTPQLEGTYLKEGNMNRYLTVSKRASSHSWTVTTYKWRPSNNGRRPPISNLFAWQQVLDPVFGTEGAGWDLWNGAIWGQRHLHSARTRSCSAHIYRCPLCFTLPAKEERKHTAVLSGTCGVQNAVITNSGRPIYVTRPAWSWWTPAYCLYSTLPASYIWHRCNQPGRTQHLLSNAGVPKFSSQVI